MLGLILTLAIVAEPTAAAPRLGVAKMQSGNALLCVNLSDKVEGRDYVRTGPLYRPSPKFGFDEQSEIPEVRLIRRPAF